MGAKDEFFLFNALSTKWDDHVSSEVGSHFNCSLCRSCASRMTQLSMQSAVERVRYMNQPTVMTD